MRPWIAVPLLLPLVAAVLVFGGLPDLPVRGARFWVTAWALAGIIGAIYSVATSASWRRGLGMALMAVPISSSLISIANTIPDLVAGGLVLRAFTEYQLSSIYSRSLLTDLGYVGVGFLLWSGWRGGGIDDIARRLQATGFPMGGRSEAASMRLGLLWFPVLLLGAIAVQVALSQGIPSLVNSDETSVWDNVTPWHGIMISAAAAVGEEAVFRGFLMTALAAVAMRAGLRPGTAWGLALAGQALIFGFAHGGYGNWLHVIQAGLFGIVAGAAALRIGIWSAIMVHFLVDIYAIGGHAPQAGWLALLVTALLLNIAYSLATGGVWAWRKWRPDAGAES